MPCNVSPTSATRALVNMPTPPTETSYSYSELKQWPLSKVGSGFPDIENYGKGQLVIKIVVLQSESFCDLLMLIPVFGSSPTVLSAEQDAVRRLILGELGRAGLEWRSLGQTDYPSSFPLREVVTLAKHCAGGVILGFAQFETEKGVSRKGTPYEEKVTHRVVFPTAWNQVEAGILFALGKPLLVFREDGILGGIFDNGVTDLFIQPMPDSTIKGKQRRAFREVLHKFAAQVLNHYHSV